MEYRRWEAYGQYYFKRIYGFYVMATSYGWVGGALGSWNDPASWTGGVAVPGPEDSVRIVGETATPRGFASSVVQGPGTADFMSIYGDVVLDGTFVVDAVWLNNRDHLADPPVGRLSIGAGSALTGDSLVGISGNSLVVNGANVTLAGDLFIAYGAALFRNGATIDVGSMNLTSTRVVLDSTSSLTVGAPGQGIAGTVVVGAGGLIYARVYPNFVMPSVINDGTIVGGGSYTENHLEINGGINNGLIVDAYILAADSIAGFINNGTIQSAHTTVIEGVSGPGLVALTQGGTLVVGDEVTTVVDFSDGAGTLWVGMSGQMPVDTELTLTNFGLNDVIKLTSAITSATYTTLSNSEGRLDVGTEVGSISFNFDGAYTAAPSLQFAYGTEIRQSDFQLYGVFPAPAPCFPTGTRIMTSTGQVAVEDLREGNLVRVACTDGFRPIIWIGHRHVDLAAHPTP